MNETTALRVAGPEAPALRPETLLAARAALLDEIDASAGPRARARHRRRIGRRVGVAGLTVAAAWTAAVVIAAPDGPPGPPPGSVTLVAFTPPSFPVSLDPVPAGMTPAFSGDADAGDFADYSSADGADRFTLGVTDEEPAEEDGSDMYEVRAEEDATIGGDQARMVSGRQVYCPGPGDAPACAWQSFRTVTWELADDVWVVLTGTGRYAGEDRLLDVAAGVVDRPQPVRLQVTLAPAGWSVLAYKDGRILTLVADGYPDQTLSVRLPEQPYPADELRAQLMGPVGPLLDVTVNGRPAQLVRTDNGPRDRGWHLQAQFPDGTTFVVQAPEAFTQEQVLAFAAQVTHAG